MTGFSLKIGMFTFLALRVICRGSLLVCWGRGCCYAKHSSVKNCQLGFSSSFAVARFFSCSGLLLSLVLALVNIYLQTIYTLRGARVDPICISLYIYVCVYILQTTFKCFVIMEPQV